VHEKRREQGRRGGIAMLIRKGIKVSKVLTSEYSQAALLQLPLGKEQWVCNVYIPPV
jgi:hypothetical protein